MSHPFRARHQLWSNRWEEWSGNCVGWWVEWWVGGGWCDDLLRPLFISSDPQYPMILPTINIRSASHALLKIDSKFYSLTKHTTHTHTSRTINYDNIYYCDVYYICTGHTTPAAQYRAIPPPIRDRQVTSALRTEQPVFLLSCTFGFFKDFQMDFSTQPNLIWIESVEEVGWLEHN